MNIKVPENVGEGDLRLLPVTNPLYEAIIADCFLGKSQANQPKLTVKYTITSEYDGPEAEAKDFEPTKGATVIESFSLQEQAIWKLNDLYKKVTRERIPAGEMSEEAFLASMKKTLVGTPVSLLLKHGMTPKKEVRLEVEKVEVIAKKSKLQKGKSSTRRRGVPAVDDDVPF